MAMMPAFVVAESGGAHGNKIQMGVTTLLEPAGKGRFGVPARGPPTAPSCAFFNVELFITEDLT